MPRRMHREKRRKTTKHVFANEIPGAVTCIKLDCQAIWTHGTSKPKSRCPDTSGKYNGN